jgi:hypothetical protein
MDHEIHECKCPAKGTSVCPIFLRTMSVRDKQICRGEDVKHATRAKYLTSWYKDVERLTPVILANQDDAESVIKSKTKSRGLGDKVKKAIDTVSRGKIKQCGGCKKRQAKLNQVSKGDLPAITSQPIRPSTSLRHLFCHVYPLQSPRDWVWRKWLRLLIENHTIWNGRKILCVVASTSRDKHLTSISSFDEYREQLLDLGFEIEEFTNNRKLREAAYFTHVLEKLKSEDPSEAICNLHTKGVTYGNHPESVVHRWGDTMFETVAANWREAINSLNGFGCTGSFKRYGQFRTLGNNRWHYSGTFYWLRSRDLFRRNWEYIDQSFFGTESYVGSHFTKDEGACLFLDNCEDLYKDNYWDQTVTPAIHLWRAQRPHLTFHKDQTSWQEDLEERNLIQDG